MEPGPLRLQWHEKQSVQKKNYTYFLLQIMSPQSDLPVSHQQHACSELLSPLLFTYRQHALLCIVKCAGHVTGRADGVRDGLAGSAVMKGLFVVASHCRTSTPIIHLSHHPLRYASFINSICQQLIVCLRCWPGLAGIASKELTTNCLRRTMAMNVPIAIIIRLYNTDKMTWTQHIALGDWMQSQHGGNPGTTNDGALVMLIGSLEA